MFKQFVLLAVAVAVAASPAPQVISGTETTGAFSSAVSSTDSASFTTSTDSASFTASTESASFGASTVSPSSVFSTAPAFPSVATTGFTSAFGSAYPSGSGFDEPSHKRPHGHPFPSVLPSIGSIIYVTVTETPAGCAVSTDFPSASATISASESTFEPSTVSFATSSAVGSSSFFPGSSAFPSSFSFSSGVVSSSAAFSNSASSALPTTTSVDTSSVFPSSAPATSAFPSSATSSASAV